MKNFKNKLIVITGAASGIGEALASQFAQEGAFLILIDNNKIELARVAKMLENNTKKTYCFDVGRYESFVKVAKELELEFGGVDVVINNAGVALGKMTAEETSIEEFQWLMNVNFWGMVNGSKAFLPQLKAKSSSVLVNISSLYGLIGVKGQSAYCSSKFAIRGFTESLMGENKSKGLHIHLVHPGGVNTNISFNARGGAQELNKVFHDKFLAKYPTAVAAKNIIKGIKANRKRILLGEGYIGEFASRLLPLKLVSFIQKHMYKEFD